MPRSIALYIAGGLVLSIGFSLAIRNYFYLTYLEDNAQLLLAPETQLTSVQEMEGSSEREIFLERALELERQQSESFHATLLAQIRTERRSSRDNALLWLAALLFFGIVAAGDSERQDRAPKRDAA
jgi:hypothetical protein